MSRVLPSPILFGLSLLLGLALLPWTAAPAQGQNVEVSSVTTDDGTGELSVPVGESLTVTIRGRNLHLIEDVTVLLGRAAARGVAAELAPAGRGDRAAQTARQATITAETGARPADEYRLRLVAGRGSADVATFAVTAAAAPPPRRTTPAPRQPERTPAGEAPEETADARSRSIQITSVTAADGSDALTIPAGGAVAARIQGENLHLLEGATVVLGRATTSDVVAQLAPARPGDRAASTVRRVTIRAAAEARASDGYRLRLVAAGQQADVAGIEVTSAPAAERRTTPPAPTPARTTPAAEEETPPTAEEEAAPAAGRTDPPARAPAPETAEEDSETLEEEDEEEHPEAGIDAPAHQTQMLGHPQLGPAAQLFGFTVEIAGGPSPAPTTDPTWRTVRGGSLHIELADASTAGAQYHTTTPGHLLIDEAVFEGPLHLGGQRSLANNSFAVEIDGTPLEHVTRVSIDDIEIDAIDATTGADWDYRLFAPGDTDYGTLTLRMRASLHGSALYEWWQSTSTGQNIRKTVSVILLDRSGSEARRYTFFETLPERWRGFVLDLEDAAVTLEELTLRIGRLEIQDSPAAGPRWALADWFNAIVAGAENLRRDVTVTELLKDGTTGRSFIYRDAFPTRYVFPSLDVSDDGVPEEAVTIRASGLDVVFHD